jgi:DNA-binding HxlR family transcriptional regulator
MAKKRTSGKKAVSCPVETTLRVIGGRWKVLILHHILEGPQRFGELRRALKGVAARTLTKQLRELESDGIIHREVHRQIPPKVEYSLNPIGRKLKPVLLAMHDLGVELERARPQLR